MKEDSPLLTRLSERFPREVMATHAFRGDETAIVRKEAILDVLRFLKEDPEMAFEVLMDLSAVDYSEYPSGEAAGLLTGSGQSPGGANREDVPRFNVVYHLYSLTHNHRIRVKAPVEEDDASVPSATALWPIANWLEREVWDMFGIEFSGHPDLRRILMYEEFQGHPLRKDYPLRKRQPLVPARKGWEWAADQVVSFPKTERFDALEPAQRERDRKDDLNRRLKNLD